MLRSTARSTLRVMRSRPAATASSVTSTKITSRPDASDDLADARTHRSAADDADLVDLIHYRLLVLVWEDGSLKRTRAGLNRVPLWTGERRIDPGYSGPMRATPRPQATNARFKANLAKGQTGLSVAFDLPTQTGYDSDHLMSKGEVGKVGVPIGHLGDMRTVFDGIPIAEMNTSMTINATAMWLLALYVARRRRAGGRPRRPGGNDAERHPQGVPVARNVHLSARSPRSG